MTSKMKKLFLSLAAAFSICMAFTACGDKTETEDNSVQKVQLPAEPETGNITTPSQQETAKDNAEADTEPLEPSSEKWSVLDPETAQSVDADFIGTIWELGDDRFYITEDKALLMEDGAQMSEGYSTDYKPDDSELIPVVYDGDTHFYMRMIYEEGTRAEDQEAGPADLAQYMTVEMKGSFQNNTFYATEIRLVKLA